VDSAEVDRAAHERAARAEYSLKLKEAELEEIQKDTVSVQTENGRLQGQLETLRKDLDLMYEREQDTAAERAAEQHRFQTTLLELSEGREKLADSGRRIQELEDEIANRDRQLKILGKLQS
jgi:predicted  nucleic acid-binding Zn-ribbon protein